mmetsp:Transcript_50546/g.133463  ORF Transcript_50546/g.133463 Transcript_50546/m.133463 type:complete len:123 (-) Transcript_50546:86-454(-)
MAVVSARRGAPRVLLAAACASAALLANLTTGSLGFLASPQPASRVGLAARGGEAMEQPMIHARVGGARRVRQRAEALEADAALFAELVDLLEETEDLTRSAEVVETLLGEMDARKLATVWDQ